MLKVTLNTDTNEYKMDSKTFNVYQRAMWLLKNTYEEYENRDSDEWSYSAMLDIKTFLKENDII